MRWEVYKIENEKFGMGMLVDRRKNNETITDWEYVGSARTKREAMDLFKAIRNCING